MSKTLRLTLWAHTRLSDCECVVAADHNRETHVYQGRRSAHKQASGDHHDQGHHGRQVSYLMSALSGVLLGIHAFLYTMYTKRRPSGNVCLLVYTITLWITRQSPVFPSTYPVDNLWLSRTRRSSGLDHWPRAAIWATRELSSRHYRTCGGVTPASIRRCEPHGPLDLARDTARPIPERVLRIDATLCTSSQADSTLVTRFTSSGLTH